MRLLRRKPPLEHLAGGGGPNHFGVRTCLAKATGTDGRYQLAAIRALPTAKPDTVVLQATDGRQAVCLITAGQMSSPRLVPTDVLPKRKDAKGVTIDLTGDHWRSSEGGSVPDVHREESAYPSILDVLPKFSERDKKPPIQFGIDLTVLNKLADALGTSKLTLFIPDIDKTSPDKPPAGGPVNGGYVKKPIAVCPATEEGKVRGIGVMVPLQPVNGVPFYRKVHRLVAEAEARCRPKSVRAAGVRPKRQPQPA